MRRALRWQTLVPRLLLLVVVLLGVQYGLGLAVRSIAVRSGETALGVPVDIGASRVSLLDHQVVLNDLRLADPIHPAESLVEADRCELDLATKPLLKKQAIVNRGHLTGVRFTTERDRATDGQNSTSSVPRTKWFQDEADAVASQWLAHLAERFHQSQTDQFESVQRTEAFCTEWSRQSVAIDARGKELNERVAELQQSVEASQANPLRYQKFLADLPSKIAELQKQFSELNSDLEKLPDQLETARRAIVAARRSDEQVTTRRVTLEPIEANAISAYLLREQAAKPLDELVDWLRWVREAVPAGPATQAKPSRGHDTMFAGTKLQPGLIIRALDLQGSARIANQPVELRGLLTDYTSNPTLHTEPVRLRVTTTGSMPIELQAVVDRTRGITRDSLVMDCQGVLLPKLSLGRADQIEMTIEPSHATLSISVAVDGERLSGDIQLVQHDVRITSTAGGAFGDVPIADALGETIGRIDSLATRISLGGTLANPSCKLWSNLGPAVAEAMERAVQRAGGQHTRALLVDAGKHVDERLTDAERRMTEQQSRWSSRITVVQAQLQSVAKSELPRDRISTERLGRRLPANSLFR
jgi:uncharacterized protein (TIGR03545 family)